MAMLVPFVGVTAEDSRRKLLLQSGAMTSTDDRRAQFDAEVRVARLVLSRRDADLLYDMWLDWLPQRDRLRASVPAPEDEPWR